MFSWFHHAKHKRLHPAQLKNALAGTARREKRELPEGDFAPNHYVIYLSHDDFQRWSGLKWKTIQQFERHLEMTIQQEQYGLEAEIFVDIEPESELVPGEFRIEASFEEHRAHEEPVLLMVPMLSHEDGIFELNSSDAQTMGQFDGDEDGTAILMGEARRHTEPLENTGSPFALLKILEGEDKGMSFYVEHVPVTVGRIGRGADIGLRDTHRHISRRQFEIVRHSDGSFHLTDLCCRDDLKIYVNGEQAEPTSPLYSGDHIRLGTAKTAVTEMEFTIL